MQGDAESVDAPVILCLAATVDAYSVGEGVSVVIGMGAACAEGEVQRQGFVQPEQVAAGDAAALQVALFAGGTEVVVELAEVV